MLPLSVAHATQGRQGRKIVTQAQYANSTVPLIRNADTPTAVPTLESAGARPRIGGAIHRRGKYQFVTHGERMYKRQIVYYATCNFLGV